MNDHTRDSRSSSESDQVSNGDGVKLNELELEVALRIVSHDDPSFRWPQAAATAAEHTTALQALIDRLVALTMEDGLTGLFNRRYFDRRLGQELRRAKREQRPCSVCIIDADHFKRINDTHGHALGDLVLKRLAELAIDVLRATDDVTSRVGGEEFAVILPGTDGPGALRAAERLRVRAERLRIPLSEGELAVTVSLGVATFDPFDPCEPEELVRRADEALYAAKAAGRNIVRMHDSALSVVTDPGVVAAERNALLR
jgi:diguanylate cyclase (GGDEF)-like protein